MLKLLRFYKFYKVRIFLIQLSSEHSVEGMDSSHIAHYRSWVNIC